MKVKDLVQFCNNRSLYLLCSECENREVCITFEKKYVDIPYMFNFSDEYEQIKEEEI